MKSAYSFTVLRYIHDVTTGEFVNVGVALCAPSAKFARAVCRTSYRRVSSLFPGLNGPAFKRMMKQVQSAFTQSGDRLEQLPLDGIPHSVMDLAHAILPADDSSLQWSPAGGGLTSDPQKTLNQLYERMVMHYDDKAEAVRRSDEDIWKSYRTTFESLNVLSHLESKKIVVEDDEVTFQHAWKNGVWHCLEPVSFDLASAESIREKAHKILGRMVSMKESAEKFKVYLLLGEPHSKELRTDYNKALGILNKLPVDKELIQESEAVEFGKRLASQIHVHDEAIKAA